MSTNVFEHPFLSGLLGDDELAEHFSAQSDLSAMLAFEAALARSCATLGLIDSDAAKEIEGNLPEFQPDNDALNDAILNNGVPLPELLRQIRRHLSPKASKVLHFGATSQDVVDTSLMMRMKSVLAIISQRLAIIIQALDELRESSGNRKLMAYTRMQAALPITVADRIDSWKQPLNAYKTKIDQLLEEGLPIQFGGAVGTLSSFNEQGPEVRCLVAQELGLRDHPQWHSQRAVITDLGHLFTQITGSLGKMGLDIALMAQQGLEIKLSGGGGSSAMPHKQNPVAAEILVTQARFSSVLVSGLYSAMIHEQERSGTAWTLEWMILPQVAMSCGAATRLARKLILQVVSIGSD